MISSKKPTERNVWVLIYYGENNVNFYKVLGSDLLEAIKTVGEEFDDIRIRNSDGPDFGIYNEDGESVAEMEFWD